MRGRLLQLSLPAAAVVALCTGLALGLRPPSLAGASAASPPPVVGTKATVWLFPPGLATSTPCDPSTSWDLCTPACCNVWWLREDGWAAYTAQAATQGPLLLSILPSPNATVLVLFPLFLADPLHAGVGLSRLNTVIRDMAAAGLRVQLFVGRPEYYGRGRSADTHDVVHNATAFASFATLLGSTLALPAVRAAVHSVSVYWLSAFCAGRGASFCTPSDVAAFNSQLRSVVRDAGFLYAQHLDGTFWDGCWAQTPHCSNATAWDLGGYSPSSIAGADAYVGESWVQGSLVPAVRLLWGSGVGNASSTLLLNDVPNCDLPPFHPCATGSLPGDDGAWFGLLQSLGLGGTWGVWDAVDGGTLDGNGYGDLTNNGSGLTKKGALHRAAVLRGQ
jgi:hypothetical protein